MILRLWKLSTRWHLSPPIKRKRTSAIKFRFKNECRKCILGSELAVWWMWWIAQLNESVSMLSIHSGFGTSKLDKVCRNCQAWSYSYAFHGKNRMPVISNQWNTMWGLKKRVGVSVEPMTLNTFLLKGVNVETADSVPLYLTPRSRIKLCINRLLFDPCAWQASGLA